MKNAIKFITIAILIGISILGVNAQNIVETSTVTEVTNGKTEKVEKKETAKKQSSNEDSWTGFYVGGFGGYTNGRANAKSLVAQNNGYFSQAGVTDFNNLGSQKITSNGFNSGGTFGYNYQKGKFLIGTEVDFGGHKVSKSVSSTSNTFGRPYSITQSVNSDWLFTARPRIGIALKKVIVYGTGGVAVTKVKYDGNYLFVEGNFRDTESGSFTRTKTGWTAGAGMEFKVSNRWSVKGEYLFSQFGRTSITSNNLTLIAPGGTVTLPRETFNHSTDLKSHSIRFGVNYRF